MVGRACNADLQSAVSQVSNLLRPLLSQRSKLFVLVSRIARLADWKSAIQQIGNLRYFRMAIAYPGAGGGRTAAVEGGGAQPQQIERKMTLGISHVATRNAVLRLVPVARTQPRSDDGVAVTLAVSRLVLRHSGYVFTSALS